MNCTQELHCNSAQCNSAECSGVHSAVRSAGAGAGVVLSGNQLLEVWRVEDDWSSPSTGWLAGASPRAVSCGLARRKVSFRLQKILKTRREICCHPLINSPKKRPKALKTVEDDKLRKGGAVGLILTDSKILPEMTGAVSWCVTQVQQFVCS